MSVRVILALGLCLVVSGQNARAQERARLLDHAVSDEATSFTVFVPPAPNAELDKLLTDQVTPGSPRYHHWLTPGQYQARFATSPARMAEVAAALRAARFTVQNIGAHTIRVAARAGDVERAFSTHLWHGAFSSGKRALVADTNLHLPDVLARQHAVVPAFQAVIRMRRHSRVIGRVNPDNRNGPDGGYWVTDLKQAYDWPDERVLNGAGVTIGIFMSNDFSMSDMKLYFGHEKLPVPSITSEPIDGGAPYSPDDSVETSLDIQQAGGMAPKAKIILYNVVELSDGGILDGLETIVVENKVDVVNMSFGVPEVLYDAHYNDGYNYLTILEAEDTLMRQGNAQGITFVASSGDSGALDAVPLACLPVPGPPGCGYFGLSADYPASSPFVTSVGGTNLVTSADPAHPTDLRSAYVQENAYYDRLEDDIFFGTYGQGAVWGSGGGVSIFEPRPIWQQNVATGSTKHRTVPDVAGHMGGCPDGSIAPCGLDRSSDIVAVSGAFSGVVGTSASSPDFAGLLALKIQHEGSRLGNENPNIYALGIAQRSHREPLQIFRDHLPGNDGYYPAIGGYNLVLGNGSVKGREFLGVMDVPAAGTPHSASNP